MTTEECLARIERNLAETGEILRRIDVIAAQNKERAAHMMDTHNILGEMLDSLEGRRSA